MAPEERRLSWLRVALLLGILAVIGAVAAMPLLARFPGKEQKEAIAQLQSQRAQLEFDDFNNVVSLRINPDTPLSALKHVAALPKLKKLGLPVTDATDEDLVHLRGAIGLEELILSGNKAITDAGLKNLENLVQLKQLLLTDVPIDGSGMAALGRLEHLEVLNLAYTKMEDANTPHLGKLTGMKVLDLSYTPCTDEALKPLSGLKNLQMLWVMNAQVSKEAGEELKKSLPNVTVRFGL